MNKRSLTHSWTRFHQFEYAGASLLPKSMHFFPPSLTKLSSVSSSATRCRDIDSWRHRFLSFFPKPPSDVGSLNTRGSAKQQCLARSAFILATARRMNLLGAKIIVE